MSKLWLEEYMVVRFIYDEGSETPDDFNDLSYHETLEEAIRASKYLQGNIGIVKRTLTIMEV